VPPRTFSLHIYNQPKHKVLNRGQAAGCAPPPCRYHIDNAESELMDNDNQNKGCAHIEGFEIQLLSLHWGQASKN